MVLLDGTITIVALPSIGAGLRFSEQEASAPTTCATEHGPAPRCRYHLPLPDLAGAGRETW